jgi:hypothetical protein
MLLQVECVCAIHKEQQFNFFLFFSRFCQYNSLKDGKTPALMAAENGHVGVLQLFRDAKVNLETPNNDGFTPAFVAAQNGHVGVLVLTLSRGLF